MFRKREYICPSTAGALALALSANPAMAGAIASPPTLIMVLVEKSEAGVSTLRTAGHRCCVRSSLAPTANRQRDSQTGKTRLFRDKAQKEIRRYMLLHLKRSATIIVLLTAAILVGGCGRDVGSRIDPTAARTLEPGITTLEEASERIGPPLRTRRYLNGRTVASWSYLNDPPLGAQVQRLDILFDAEGRMIRIQRQYKNVKLDVLIR